jgi:hypothetical protein
MSEYCTIISPVKDFRSMITILRQLGAEVSDIDGTEQEWRSVSLKSDVSKLVFNSMIRQFPGDEFSKLVLGIHNFARKLQGADIRTAQTVLDAIANAQLLIGVVASPGFLESNPHQEYVLGIAKSVGGLIFSGDAILDSSGNPLLKRQ